MQAHILLKQYDLLEGTEKVIADCFGQLDENRLYYPELQASGIYHDVLFTEDEVILKRISEFSSTTRLTKNGKSKSVVDSPYGKMELQTELKRMRKSEDSWMVEYMIVGDGEVLTHQKLIWEIKGAAE